VIEVKGKGLVLPSFPGIPNESFITDVANKNSIEKTSAMLTKREVRLAILSLIQANNADVIWDVGAGCGSVAVELAYWNKQVQVHAIEHHEARLACLEANRDRFGVVSQLNIIAGKAPEKLSGLPDPTKVFIGGSGGSLPEILMLAWQKLPIGGLLVASAVTEATKQYLFQFMNMRESAQDVELETLQVSVSKGSKLAGQLLYRPSLPVTLFKFMKLAEQKND
jgi:precorrin-6Y C5,15-methyltransferase (decarboxylating)